MQTYHRWVRGSIAANKPYDQFVRELLTANGSDFLVGPANYYRAVQKREPQTYAEATAVLFMGARLDCARCHAHPTENWGQDDGLGMAAFFSKVAIKATQEWKEEIVFFNQHGGVYHPQNAGLRQSEVPGRGSRRTCRAIRTRGRSSPSGSPRRRIRGLPK